MPAFEEIKKEYETLLQQLSDPGFSSNWEKFEELLKKKGYFEKIIAKEQEIREIKNRIEENKIIISSNEDQELVSLAEAELNTLSERTKVLEEELDNLITQPQSVKKDKSESVIIEIREGTGGKEAALFAANLFNMYSKYGESQGWQSKVLDSHPTELKGLKEIVFELSAKGARLPDGQGSAFGGKNSDAFSKMKYEGGVHRVQRIPETEKSGRIHTSTATVAVLPKPKSTQIKINPNDLKIDLYNASGPGGQNVNKRETAVRITHLPTGLVVTSQSERNQLQNKENALSILEAKLLEKKNQEEMEKSGDKRRLQIGWAKRAEKIRTYNFPQDRVTDHRIKKNFHNIEGIMEGKLEPIIEALRKFEVESLD